jgi:hypothetical protein
MLKVRYLKVIKKGAQKCFGEGDQEEQNAGLCNKTIRLYSETIAGRLFGRLRFYPAENRIF